MGFKMGLPGMFSGLGCCAVIGILPAFFLFGFFCQTNRAAVIGFPVATYFFITNEHQFRHAGGFTLGIQRYKGEIGRGCMTGLTRGNILGLNTHADLHGGSAHQVDTGFDGEQVADVHWIVKIEPIDGSGYHGASGMLNCHHAGGIIDMFHNHAAMGNAGQIGILGLHHVAHDNAAMLYGFFIHRYFFVPKKYLSGAAASHNKMARELWAILLFPVRIDYILENHDGGLGTMAGSGYNLFVPPGNIAGRIDTGNVGAVVVMLDEAVIGERQSEFLG